MSRLRKHTFVSKKKKQWLKSVAIGGKNTANVKR